MVSTMKETVYKRLSHKNDSALIYSIATQLLLFLLNNGVPQHRIKYILGYADRLAKTRYFNDILQYEKDYVKAINPYCAICGNENNLTIHHIKPVRSFPWLKYDINNFMVLCGDCHYKLHNGGIKGK